MKATLARLTAFLRRLLGKRITLYALLELGLCYLVIHGSNGLAFATAEKALLYALSLLCALFVDDSRAAVRRLLQTRLSKVFFALLCGYAAFALVGNALFITSLGGRLRAWAEALLRLALTAVWVAPALLMALSGMLRCQGSAKEARKRTEWCIGGAIFALVLCVGAVYCVAYNPAIYTVDSERQLYQAVGEMAMSGWYSPALTLMIRLVYAVVPSVSALALLQCAFFAAVFASGGMLLYRLSHRVSVAIAYGALMAVLPNNTVHFATLWKDVPYAASLLWACVLIGRYALEKNRSLWVCLQGFVCLTLIILLRQNGFVAAAIPLAALLIEALCALARRRAAPDKRAARRAILRPACVALAVVACAAGIQGPVYRWLNVIPSPVGGKYVGLGQDIRAVAAIHGQLSESAQRVEEGLSEGGRYAYDPRYAESSYSLDMPMSEFLGAYLDTLVHNPMCVLRSILGRMDCAWDVKLGKTSAVTLYNYTGASSWSPETLRRYVPDRVTKLPAITSLLNEYQSASTQPVCMELFWRGGIWTLLALTGLFALLAEKKRRAYALLLLPMLGQALSLLLSTGWPDYRYFWPLILCAQFFLFALLCRNGADAANPPCAA